MFMIRRGLRRALWLLASIFLSLFVAPAANAQFAFCPALSSTPEPYLTALKFPQAWNKTCGTAYVAIVDRGADPTHPRLQSGLAGNLRVQLSKDCRNASIVDTINADGRCVPSGTVMQAVEFPAFPFRTGNLDEQPLASPAGRKGHGTHVAGIVAARESATFAGGCRRCSLMLFTREDKISAPGETILAWHTRSALTAAYSSGAQVINLSAGAFNGPETLNTQILEILKHDVLFVAASGNADKQLNNNAIEYPASKSGVLAIGGLKEDITFWTPETAATTSGKFGSASGNKQFLAAPARRVFSTFYTGAQWVTELGAALNCVDGGGAMGYCSGTSMAAPYVTAVAGLVRSANPTMDSQAVMDTLRTSATWPSGGTVAEYGNGIPDAEKAVTFALGGAGVVNRKTPLFALHSSIESNHIFTTVPQVAMAAIEGRLPPRAASLDVPASGDENLLPPMNRYVPAGSAISGYGTFVPAVCPIFYMDFLSQQTCSGWNAAFWGTPLASASILTTPKNPLAGGPELRPLYRLSSRCGDAGVDAGVCAATSQKHIRHFYSSDDAEVTTALSQGYRLDGVEGFVMPTTQSPLPTDAVKLCRKYNAARDDYILFAGSSTDPTLATACATIPSAVAGAGSGTYADWNGTHFVGYGYTVGASLPVYAEVPVPVPSALEVVSGTPQSATVTQAFGAPLRARIRDQVGNPMQGLTVTFAGPGTGSGISVASVQGTTDASGIASVNVTANQFAGMYNVLATSGTLPSASFTLTNLAGPAVGIATVSGSGQTAAVGSAFPLPLRVRVQDLYGNPVANATVSFAAAGGAASATLSAPLPTDVNGHTSVIAQATGVAGGHTVTATLFGIVQTQFVLTNTAAPPPPNLAVQDGTPQSALVGAAFAQPIRAILRDASNNPIAGATVSFSAPGSGASAVLSAPSAVTNASGIASVTATANATAGSYTVAASSAGASPVSFTLTNQALAATTLQLQAGSPQSTGIGTAFAAALQVIVRDQNGNAFPGATVTYGVPASGASATLSSPTAITNASGIASVTATANSTGGGPYNVTANVSGIANTVNFALTNNACSNQATMYESSALTGINTLGPDMLLADQWTASFPFTIQAGQRGAMKIYYHTQYSTYPLPDNGAMTISQCKGDFNVTAPNCSSTGGQYIEVQFGTSAQNGCVLQPGVQYYMNYKQTQCVWGPGGTCGLRGYRTN